MWNKEEGRKCKICGKELKGNQELTCSIKCSATYRKSNKIKKGCKECGATIVNFKKSSFCSNECYNKYINKNHIESEHKDKVFLVGSHTNIKLEYYGLMGAECYKNAY